jgi:phosphonate transport system substrate-binding protein
MRSSKILLCGFALLALASRSTAKTIHISTVGDSPTAEIKVFMPLANYLAKQLESEGYTQGKVIVAGSVREVGALLREGKTDLYIDSPFPTVAASRMSGSQLFLLREKRGLKEYHSVIFTRRDSGLARLRDLAGKVVAFKEPFSSSGYFVPKMVMAQQGLKLTAKKDPGDPVSPTQVGYVFSGANENTVAWVARKKVAAGALDNQVYAAQASAAPMDFKIIYQTVSFPRHIVSRRGDLSPELAKKIKAILLRMHRSEEGSRVLEQFEKTARFSELPSETVAPFLKAGKFLDAEFGF